MMQNKTYTKWKTKPRITAILLLCLFCLLLAGGPAKAETVTLQTLRETAPASVCFTIDGTVYEVPVILPEANTLPLLRCRSAVFDTTDLRQRYPLETTLNACAQIADAYWNHQDSTLINYYVGDSSLIFGTTDISGRASLPIGETPPESDLTLDDIMDIVYARIAEFQGDSSADLRIWRAVAKSGLYGIQTRRFPAEDGSGTSYQIQEIDKTRPVPGASRGLWSIVLTQYLHGIPVFPDNYSATAEYTPESLYRPEPVYGDGRFLDETNMELSVGYLTEHEILARDTALAPFSAVTAAIEARIQSGQLKNIFQLTLGYTVFLPADADLDAVRTRGADVDYLLLPTWQICGYDEKDRQYRSHLGYTVPVPDKQTILQDLGGHYELRLDAVTAAPVEHMLVNMPIHAQ